MTLEQRAALPASGESETLEFKETTGTRREATMTVCAFLNQRGGQVLFGVMQAGVVGQQVSKRVLAKRMLKALLHKLVTGEIRVEELDLEGCSGNRKVTILDYTEKMK